MKQASIDYSLYLVTDRGLARGRALLDVVRAAVQGGVTCVQLREKTCSTREFIEEALAIKEFLRSRGVPLIINDRVDVALAVGADGVHLGQKDMPLAAARAIVTDTMLIGISAESLADAVAAQQGGADYLGRALDCLQSALQVFLPQRFPAECRKAARLLGMPSVIVMPQDAPAIKIEATRGYGAEVVLYNRYEEDREAIGQRLARERGMTLIPPYDHPDVMAGQGTAWVDLATGITLESVIDSARTGMAAAFEWCGA